MIRSPVTTTLYEDPDLFRRDVVEPMSARPIQNNVFLIAAQRLGDEASPPHLRLASFQHGRVILAAWMIAPFRLGLCDLGEGDQAMTSLVLNLRSHGRPIPGVAGPERLTNAFCEAWFSTVPGVCTEPGQSCRQMLYRIERVLAPHVLGRMRPARLEEAPKLIDWQIQFGRDIAMSAPELSPEYVALQVKAWIQQGQMHVWSLPRDDTPVACAVEKPFQDQGARISGVFTPKTFRGQGYASALTAALSSQILTQGRWCVLFADMMNPLTNRIYQRIGYNAVAPYADIHFSSI